MKEGKEQRRLAAVMFCDIKGYTALVQRDERDALQKVSKFRSTLEEQTEAHQGEVIEFYGDGSLSVYQSVIDAIRCAIEMQTVYNHADHQVPVRIGIHVGDIVFKDGTVYGDGVNLASRIEATGVPGAILISEKVNRELFNHPEIETESIGHYRLKNISDEIEIFAIRHPNIVRPKGQIEKARRSRNVKAIRKFGVSALVIVLAVFLFNLIRGDNMLKSKSTPTTTDKSEKISVLPFANAMRIDSLDFLRDLAGDFMTRDLLKTEQRNVTAYRTLDERNSLIDNGTENEDEQINPSDRAVYVIEGSFFPEGDSIRFLASILDTRIGEYVFGADDQIGPKSNPIKTLQNLNNEVKGFWESKDENLSSPPNYESYRAFLRARDAWNDDNVKVERELTNAIRLDSSFSDPYFHLFTFYFDYVNKYEEAGRILNLLKKRSIDFTERQIHQVNQMEADLEGKNIDAYEYYLHEYEEDPQDLFINTSAMVYANNYVNFPEKVIEMYDQIPSEQFDYNQCSYCAYRLYMSIIAYLKMGKTRRAKEVIALIPERIDWRNFYDVLIRHAAYESDTSQINRVFEKARRSSLQESDLIYLRYAAARELKLRDNTELSTIYADRALSSLSAQDLVLRALLYDIKSDYTNALAANNEVLDINAGHVAMIGKKGVLHAKLGQESEARAIIEQLNQLKKPFQYGMIPFYQIAIYAHLGDREMAIQKAQQAIDEGRKFLDIDGFETSIDLMILYDDPDYLRLMKPLESLSN